MPRLWCNTSTGCQWPRRLDCALTTKGYDHKTPIRTSFDQRFDRYSTVHRRRCKTSAILTTGRYRPTPEQRGAGRWERLGTTRGAARRGATPEQRRAGAVARRDYGAAARRRSGGATRLRNGAARRDSDRQLHDTGAAARRGASPERRRDSAAAARPRSSGAAPIGSGATWSRWCATISPHRRSCMRVRSLSLTRLQLWTMRLRWLQVSGCGGSYKKEGVEAARRKRWMRTKGCSSCCERS